MAPELQEWADEWAVGAASNEEIDEWGIRVAIAVAADRALCSLRQRPHHILIDGPSNLLRAPVNVAIGSAMPPLIGHADVPATMLVKGDQVSATIAAAAVIAKVQRDALMVEQSHVYPEYGWNGNKGYGSDAHREAIRRLGPSPLHRVSWNLT
jgi:ribonuclease HII